MSKQIVTSGWVSIVSNKLFNSWVKKKWIPKEAEYISCGDDDEIGEKDILEMEVTTNTGDRVYTSRLSNSKSETKRLKAQGFRKKRTQYFVTEEIYNNIKNDIAKWYDEVFTYVDKLLNMHGYIDLKSGSFDGGFCAETNPDHEVVKSWGAPLAGPLNKVVQIKEKFGRITVYFTSLTKEEQKEVKKFEKMVKKKFDCEAFFI